MKTYRKGSGHVENVALQDIGEERSDGNKNGGTGPKDIEHH